MLPASGRGKKGVVQRLKKTPRRKPNEERIAIIDLGTNSVRFDVYQRSDQTLLRLHREKRMIRLGEGVFHSGRINPRAVQRCLRAFKSFQYVMRSLHVDVVRAFGTSALRSAKNAPAVLKTLLKETGINVQVISGAREGALIANGIFAHLRPPRKPLALVDIGGGSVEISLCMGSRVYAQKSMKLGAARMQQMFFDGRDNVLQEGSRFPELALRQHIRSQLRRLAVRRPCAFVIGSSGTIRSLDKMLQKLNPRAKPASRTELSALVAEMRLMNRSQLLRIPGMEPKRVDLILAGAIVFEEILYFLGAKRFYSTQFALRDGILSECLNLRKSNV
jgi:exopolyphosphatase / guanosine-5'-triphosphate,3'-diphosphate pyrophosphatase